MAFGPHLMVDCYHFDDINKLYDVEFISKFLRELAIDTDMTPITDPQVIKYEDERYPDNRGVTGNLIIAESHINIHTFPVKDFAFVDVFSCKTFNIDDTLELISMDLNCDYDKYVVKRGSRFRR